MMTHPLGNAVVDDCFAVGEHDLTVDRGPVEGRRDGAGGEDEVVGLDTLAANLYYVGA